MLSCAKFHNLTLKKKICGLQWGSKFQFGQIEMKRAGKIDHLDDNNPALIQLDVFKGFTLIHL